MQKSNAESIDYEKDDLISFQFMSFTINVGLSQLIRYSKRSRERYQFSDAAERIPQDLCDFQASNNLVLDNILYFFQLFNQNCNIKENSMLTYIQCSDLLKMSKFFEVRKITDQIDQYIKSKSIDTDFIIQMIQYQTINQNQNQKFKIELNSELENLLVEKINECLLNKNFAELPIYYVYRIVEKGSKKEIQNDSLFDMIKKDIKKFCVLFPFLDLQKISKDRLYELYEIYQNSDDENKQCFGYLECNLHLIIQLIKDNECIQEKLNETENTNKEQNDKIIELKSKINILENEKNTLQNKFDKSENKNTQLQSQLKDAENKNSQLQSKLKDTENKSSQLKSQLKDIESKNNQLQKQLDSYKIKGQIRANVTKGLLIYATINLVAEKATLDTTKSKYIISTNNSETLGNKAYESGEPIESLNTSTISFLCKEGTYYVRCIAYSIEGQFVELISNPVTTCGKSVSFEYEGKPSKVKLLKGKYNLQVWGAKGGDSTGKRQISATLVKGGLGGYSKGTLTLNKDEMIYVYVGGEGQPSKSSRGDKTKGGFPDGGDTQTGHRDDATSVPGTGGGSTSIRISNDSLYSRVIVAGGGGGAAGDSLKINPGGFGGGLSGCNCYYYERLEDQGAGTQTGSTCGLGCNTNGDPGSFGQGANNKCQTERDSGGGGGGGWYGGGSGGIGGYWDCSGGGGGSGWTFTESSFNTWKSGDSTNAEKFLLIPSHYLTDTSCISGNEEFPRTDGNGNERGHSGNGYAKITIE